MEYLAEHSLPNILIHSQLELLVFGKEKTEKFQKDVPPFRSFSARRASSLVGREARHTGPCLHWNGCDLRPSYILPKWNLKAKEKPRAAIVYRYCKEPGSRSHWNAGSFRTVADCSLPYVLQSTVCTDYGRSFHNSVVMRRHKNINVLGLLLAFDRSCDQLVSGRNEHYGYGSNEASNLFNGWCLLVTKNDQKRPSPKYSVGTFTIETRMKNISMGSLVALVGEKVQGMKSRVLHVVTVTYLQYHLMRDTMVTRMMATPTNIQMYNWEGVGWQDDEIVSSFFEFSRWLECYEKTLNQSVYVL